MYLAKIYVTYKKSILDPQGEVVKSALHRLSYTNVEAVTCGKYFEIKLDTTDKAAAAKEVEAFSDELLININMESFTYDLSELAEAVD
ncbi:phosphoribosylformylglycinamidine synthase subunit PurS [Oenococcus kitaharae]|uniref:Phosphoribosylformylglycinamidine synthase subunit PurS n=1 Tax=Oenococcus kitaharae DSM 17330 TaxID=1045004 RepID=G9WH07_9LACO|nr:phosphoribosylformylglycinamidine synthase subunit PurS [Oenococcus kitaharae]EHN59415.1 Phosphoribosylformylglycinamidine synthase PurS-like subunit [Oenococcus kitaharae DSM 17330]OEY83290.1 phosphoribosylformylglycinamidine synthase [Oenococcus kitaharae]OEY85088.1 phosphoribosylformylglycinamidine synthase [Oenococcus kitaharae]OEY85943.1 phosphoribosylformylglycinamidine synthase [Oenococcus kitaharae]